MNSFLCRGDASIGDQFQSFLAIDFFINGHKYVISRFNMRILSKQLDNLTFFGVFGFAQFVFVLILNFKVLPDFSVNSTENGQLLKIEFSKVANSSKFS